MSVTPPAPIPNVGDVFVRSDEHLGRFESMVIARNYREQDWRIHLFTDNGVEEVSKSDFNEPRGHDQWRPLDWRWDESAFMFAPVNWQWDVEKEQWVEREVEEDAEEPSVDALPPKTAIPKPEFDEHHASWRARCRRKFPSLATDEGNALLGEYWHELKDQS